MPLSENELRNSRGRVMMMFMDTIATFEAIENNAETLFGENAGEMRSAINECLNDFLRNAAASGEKNPEALIYETPRENLQRAGFYGAQLNVKERQVSKANASLRESLPGGAGGFWKKPFRKWVDVINNFLGSLAGATGLSEALKELKDCLRDELPDDDE